MKIKIDGLEVEVSEGETILQVANRLGIRIPTLCYLEGIYEEASCRICVVELRNGKLVPACIHKVSDGLVVYTNTNRVRDARRVTLELLLASHRMECQSCPMKGNCVLADLCSEYGVEGIPVCAECPLHGKDCLLNKGEVCLGPITMSGCKAKCPREKEVCEGCRGPITRRDVLEYASKLYTDYEIPMKDVLNKLRNYCGSSREYDLVYQYMVSRRGEK